MTSIAKLKDRARKHEQKEDWQAAIQAYQKVLETEEGANEFELELGLYNRIGDLNLRIGQTDAAVSYYETAADKYAEAGFINNAIALCNKALRHRPNRPEIYLKLSGLCAEQGFQTDARRWILEYSERQMKAGRVEEALTGLENFADLSRDPEVRETLAQQLASHDRPEEAVQQLRHAYHLRAGAGDAARAASVAERARAIDPSADFESETPPPDTPAEEPGFGELAGFGDETTAGQAPAPSAGGLDGLETGRAEISGAEAAEIGGLEGLEATAAGADPGAVEEVEVEELGLETFQEEPEEEEPEPLPLLDSGFEEEAEEDAEEEDAEEEPEPLPTLDSGLDELQEEPAEEPAGEEAVDEWSIEEPAAEEEPAEEAAGEEAADEWSIEEVVAEEEPLDEGAPEDAEPLPSLDLSGVGGGPVRHEGARELDEEEAAGAMDLDLTSFSLEMDSSGAPPTPAGELDVEAVLQRAREQVSRGLTAEALRELRLLSGSAAGPDTFAAAVVVVNEIVRHDANDVAALQQRVEFAGRTGDRELLVDAYTDLADALARLGAETKAQAMYERVLAMEPTNEAAREALGGAEGGEGDMVDLDAVLREVEPDELAPRNGGSGADSDPDLAAMLSQFKAKVTDRVESDEPGDHYDLGLAFKEMGLIDEAIAEFQAALTGGTERLKVYEELGQCFIQKSQYTVALKVLSRALKVPSDEESELLGVYYHLGKCHEELGQRAEARDAYEKVLAIDASFEDVPARVARL